MRTNWVATYGQFNTDGEGLTFDGASERNESANSPSPGLSSDGIVPHVIARSDAIFEQGDISLRFKIQDVESKVQIGISGVAESEIYGGTNILGALYGLAKFGNGKWEGLGGAGHGGTISIDKWHDMKLRVRGSNIDLFFNNVKVVSAAQQPERGEVTLILMGRSKIEIQAIEIAQRRPTCFVAMQFTPEFNTLFEEVIRPACENFGYIVLRADDLYTNGAIIDDITSSLRNSTIVIADITPDNPNVFYEVGYAHAIGKPTILLSDKSRQRLPFDVAGIRTIFYENSIGGKRSVEQALQKHLEGITNSALG